MADSSKSKNPAPAVDEEAKAAAKKEKEARKAAFMAAKGEEIAAQKAAKEQNKKQKGQQQKAPAGNAPQAGGSTKQQVSSVTAGAGKAQKSTEDLNKNPKKQTSSSKSDTMSEKKGKGSPESSAGKTGSSNKENALNQVIQGVKNLEVSSDASKSKKPVTPAKLSAVSSAKGTGKSREPKSQSRVQTLFDHLPKGVEPRQLFEEGKGISSQGIHPSFTALGLMYSHDQLHGSNKRVIALLNVVGIFFESYTAPPEKDFKYDIATSLKHNLEFLRKCRPFAVAMNNTVDYINGVLRDIQVSDVKNERDIKNHLAEVLQTFREEKIDKAAEAIVDKAKRKIVEDDVVLIFGCSDLVRTVVVEASTEKSFSVIIVDGRPYANQRKSKGLDIINQLGNKVQLMKYTSITGLSNVIRSVTKVILGAHALLNNGGVLAHAGTSQIALMASANNIPVIVCCETLKFCDKSPTDSFFLNEIGTGFGLDKKYADVMTPENGPYLTTPVIKYDVTPPELVTAVITDVDILPCTSVPVVLRVQENRPLLKF